MTHHVTITVKIEREDRLGRRKVIWERAVTEEGGFPPHLVQSELFHVAHAQLHPPRRERPHNHD